jgi:hypothetical protein
MTTSRERENFIPLPKEEVSEALAEDAELTPKECDAFRSYCRLVSIVFHFEYYQRLEKLKSAYAPFDPDADTRTLFRQPAEEHLRKENLLFNDVAQLLEGASYRHLNRDEIVEALSRPSAWGLRMDVDFHMFERLAILVRGETSERRSLRRISRVMRSEQLDVPIYQRVVMLMKMRPSKRLGGHVDSQHVYLQLFKNIPQSDVSMLLPGARARMSWTDRGRVIVPIVTGLALTAWQIFRDVKIELTQVVEQFRFKVLEPAAIWALATGALGYGMKSYYNYFQTRQSYNLALTQTLYYQNLDTNLGVLYRILDEAEEQDCREAMLTYFFLWKRAGEAGWTPADLQQYVEKDLARRAQLEFHFDTRNCLPRLERYRLVEKVGDRYRAVPPAQALEKLESVWQGYLHPDQATRMPTPVPAT